MENWRDQIKNGLDHQSKINETFCSWLFLTSQTSLYPLMHYRCRQHPWTTCRFSRLYVSASWLGPIPGYQITRPWTIYDVVNERALDRLYSVYSIQSFVICSHRHRSWQQQLYVPHLSVPSHNNYFPWISNQQTPGIWDFKAVKLPCWSSVVMKWFFCKKTNKIKYHMA